MRRRSRRFVAGVTHSEKFRTGVGIERRDSHCTDRSVQSGGRNEAPHSPLEIDAMSLQKTAIVVLSDPNGGDESFGRLFNALAAAYDFKQRKADVRVLFQGAGTRWAGVLASPEHPAHALYEAVEDTVVGVSGACAVAFGAKADAEKNGLALVTTNAVPGTPGLPSLATYTADGYTVLTF
jgi:DsrE/DsrF/DsrH-like protein